MTFALQLRSERKRLRLTQAEMAALLDISPRALWQWEQGQDPLVLTQEGALARLKRRTSHAVAAQRRRKGHSMPASVLKRLGLNQSQP